MLSSPKKIASFKIDHIHLRPGLYVSRVDKQGDVTVTTFDLRLVKPNTLVQFTFATARAGKRKSSTLDQWGVEPAFMPLSSANTTLMTSKDCLALWRNT